MENGPIDKGRLMAMLANSKKILDKVETGSFTKGHVSENQIGQNGDQLLSSIPDGANYESNYNYANQNPNGIPQTHMNANTSKMDPRIIKAMMENPIIPEQAHIGTTFTLDDVNESGYQYRKPPQRQVNEISYQPANQAYNGERIITMTESELDAKIKSALLDFMTTTFTKTLTETTIKRTIGTLIKEGKIRVKQK